MADGIDRRELLVRTIRFITLGLGVMLAGTLGFLFRRKIRKRTLYYVPVLDADDLPRRGVRQVTLEIPSGDTPLRMRAFVVAGTDGGHFSLSARCTHLGCFVNWDRNRSEFICPCHGGRYNLLGEVVGGPPPAPLRRLPLEIRDGKAFVGYLV